MEQQLTAQEEEELLDQARRLRNTDPFETLCRAYANDPAFVAAFARDTGHRLPKTPGTAESLAAQMNEGVWLGFSLYVLRHLRAQGWRPPLSAARHRRAWPPSYDDDFYAWTQATAAAIRSGAWEVLDRDNLAEEVEDLGISQRHALRSHLKQLVMHLLKWRYEPGGRQAGHSWRASIRNARQEIDAVLEDSPSLKRTVPDLLARQYPRARLLAQDETGLPLQTFPEACPWTPEQVLDDDFWPEG